MKYHFCSSIHDIDQEQWNKLCGKDYPFLRHEFFSSLEDSDSTTSETGWQAHHLVIEQDQLIAVMPLFLKDHSYGEYVFDWAWAEAWHHNGYHYYPKLLNASPFTPATGPRWGIKPNLSEGEHAEIEQELLKACEQEVDRLELSSMHCLFNLPEKNQAFQQRNHFQRIGCQYHWLNQDYQNFEEFLASFNSRKRKSLKRERRKVLEQGIQLEKKEGKDITEQEWELFYQLYHLTYFKRSGRQGYLTQQFFQLIAERLSDTIMMVQAYQNEKMIAAALFFKDSSALYGRYWGAIQEYDQLHFEACYYQEIEYAIEHGLQRFDPGAQGEHKIQRGFTPTLSYSQHWTNNELFIEPLQRFLKQETRQVKEYQRQACERLPFKSPDQ